MATKKKPEVERERQGDAEADNEEGAGDKDREASKDVKETRHTPNPWDPGPGKSTAPV